MREITHYHAGLVEIRDAGRAILLRWVAPKVRVTGIPHNPSPELRAAVARELTRMVRRHEMSDESPNE